MAKFNESTLETIGDYRAEEALDLLLGDMLGQGEFRWVYRCLIAPDYVVKIEKEAPFNNLAEWELWEAAKRIKGGKWAQWLAPCRTLSYGGRVMLQRYCEPLADVSELPPRIPNFIDDAKPANWGRLDGRVVCFDYGWNKSTKLLLNLAKLAKPDLGTLGERATRRWGTAVVGSNGQPLSAGKTASKTASKTK